MAEPAARAALDAERRVEARADLDQVDRDARRLYWESYTGRVLGNYADASYGMLLPQQNPQGHTTHWWSSGRRTLLLVGPSGHGKSVAAYAIANTVAAADRDAPRGEARVRVRAWNVASLHRLLAPPAAHERWDAQASTDRDRVLRELLDADLVLLDDLGREPATDFWGWSSLLYEVLESRTQDGGRKRTIITMNAAKQDQVGDLLNERYGSPLYTRIKQDCRGVWVEGDEMRDFVRHDDLFD